MIEPTIGRVVWVKGRPGAIAINEPEPALISYVHGNRCINVGGFDANGLPFSFTSLPLLQDDDPSPDYAHALWMPFQKGQAQKTEALEKKLAGAA
jgi:hypothetical protein